MKMRLGIIGTGRIARRFAAECSFVDGIEISAVYNPHKNSAKSFALSFGSEQWYATDDLEGFFGCVDLVYIASPHQYHYDYIMASLDHGRHVLCEKPLCLSKEQAEEVFRRSATEGLIVMEGLKSLYCPGFIHLRSVVESGVIGDVCNVEACFTKLERPDSRELTDTEYGGSFLELGSYVMLPVFSILGMGYTSVSFSSLWDENGVDIFTRVSMEYPNGMSTMTCGLGVKSEGRLLLSGTKGYIVVDPPWWKTTHFEVHFEDATQMICYDDVFEGDGLRYELREFLKRVESPGSRDEYEDGKLSVAMAGMMESFLDFKPHDFRVNFQYN